LKKTVSFLLAIFITFTLAACGNTKKLTVESDTGVNNSQLDSSGQTPSSEANSNGTSEQTPASEANSNGTGGQMPSSKASPNSAGKQTPENASKILVAYFSCTNTTRPLAKYVADSLDADLYEIVPVNPYTTADLNYNDDKSRSTKEMKDPNSRPAISGSVSDMAKYDIVFIAYPIWWGEAPRIVSTFMESYDFSGKTIIPFCTSSSSGIGSSGTNLSNLTKGAKWLPGKRFGGGTSRSDMVSWVNGLGLNATAK
jgi:flavodoxin